MIQLNGEGFESGNRRDRITLEDHSRHGGFGSNLRQDILKHELEVTTLANRSLREPLGAYLLETYIAEKKPDNE